MASGGTITVTLGALCDAFGLNPYPDTVGPNLSTLPQHGTVTMVNSSNGEFTYTNNGDGATSDSFVMTDASDNPFTLNVAIARSDAHTSELQSLMRISYAVFCLKKKKQTQ